MEQFRVGDKTYQVNQLRHVDDGGSGSVYELGARKAVKIYYDKPSGPQTRKLIHLFDIGGRIGAQANGAAIAMPLEAAIDPTDAAIAGFSMHFMESWLPLSLLNFDTREAHFRERSGFRFNDDSAVGAVFELFGLLAALEKHHIALGDISGKNILIDPQTGKPGLIDMDSVHFEDWESDSQGTPGYVDPHVFDGDLNAVGGYHFDSKSDVFAMTVVAFSLLVGLMPFNFAVHPPPKNKEEFARQRLSSFRIAVEGDACLRSLGLRLPDQDTIVFVQERLAEVRRVKGRSGQDGELLFEHFADVFVRDNRQNLIQLLPEQDNRSPVGAVFERLRTRAVLVDLGQKFADRPRPPAAVAPQTQAVRLTAAARSAKPFLARDPVILGDFLNSRQIDIRAMVS